MGCKNCREHRNNLVKVHHFAEAEKNAHWSEDLLSDSMPMLGVNILY